MKKTKKNYLFFRHKKCEFFPCHEDIPKKDFNCLFCYCPLYFLKDNCGGNFTFTESNTKDCSNCTLPHIKGNYHLIISRLEELENL